MAVKTARSFALGADLGGLHLADLTDVAIIFSQQPPLKAGGAESRARCHCGPG